MEHNRRIFGFVKSEGRETFGLQDLPKDVMTKCEKADLKFEEIVAVILYSGALLIFTLTQSSSFMMCCNVCQTLLHGAVQ